MTYQTLKALFSLSVAILLANWANAAATFTDNFGNGSTLNGTSVPGGTPMTSSTSYDIAASKNGTTGPTIGPGKLRLSLNSATTSGFLEAQALFTGTPVSLATVGDYINLTYTFTNTGGTLLAGGTNSYIINGLYNSGGAVPVAGQLNNSGLNTSSGSAYAANNCAGWQGYVSRISNGGISQAYTRPTQNPLTGTTSANQDLIGNSFGGGAYTNPPGVVFDIPETATVSLASGGTYTISYTIALTAIGTLTVTNNLYNGVGTGGTMIFSQTNTASGTANIIQSFDGLAISVRNSGTSLNATMDISQIVITRFNTYTLTYTAGPNGTISGTTPQTVNYGASGSAVTAVPNTGYHFVNWSDGVATPSRTDGNVANNISVTANFAVNTCTLTYTAGANGTISGTSPQTVNYGASGSAVTAVPNTGFRFVNWSDGVATPSRTDANVTNNISVTANFAVTTIADALDAPGLVWTNSGMWTIGSSNVAHDGVSCAMDYLTLYVPSGPGGSSSPSFIQTVVSGPALVSFWWKQTSTGDSGSGMPYFTSSLTLLVDGQSVAGSCSGCGWLQQTIALSSGSHTLQWSHNLSIYMNGALNALLSGYAYLDQVVVTPVTAPMITVQPQNQTVSGGANVTFTAQAIGAIPLYYQWQFNTTNLLGATNVSLTVSNVQPQNAGTYSLMVSNSYSTAVSSNALLTVLTTPAITQQPYAQTVNAGSPASFTVLASGAAPLWYQWCLNSNWLGAFSTNNSCLIASVLPGDAGFYSVIVSNAYGAVISSNVLLTVQTIPVIYQQPYGQSYYEGDIAQFYVNAAGPTPLRYQWGFNGSVIVGATNSTLMLAGITTNRAGLYSVVVSNSYGAVLSSNALLTVVPLAANPSLGDAVNAPALVWRTSGWQSQTNTTHDGVDAAYCTLSPFYYGTAWMGTTVVGPGKLSFYWLVLGQGSAFIAKFWLDGTEVLFSFGSSPPWQQNELVLGPGEHALHWEFSTYFLGFGSINGSAYVDQVTFIATPQPIIVVDDGRFGFATNQFGFNLTGSSNQVVVVEGCTNLTNPAWSPVSTNTLNTFIGTNGTAYFSDQQWTNYPGRFYRLRSP